ncbi:hypothetical protein [Arthrobacter sp. AD-310]
MNRPDSGSPDSQDQGADPDDAVWLDLVARLQGDPAPAPDAPEGPETQEPQQEHRASFRDFDPLGLAGTAPLELPAERRDVPGHPDADAGEPWGPRDYGVDDDEDGFVPEEPPSLAGTDPLTMLAWLAAVGGPVALLLSAMFWRSAPLLAIIGIVTVFVLGTVYLIMKLPQDKDEDDDGARV